LIAVSVRAIGGVRKRRTSMWFGAVVLEILLNLLSRLRNIEAAIFASQYP
jgi:hypothetical protein